MSDETAADPNVLEIQAGGKTWKLGRIGFGVRLEAEDEIRKLRRIEFKAICETISDLPERDKETATLSAFDMIRNVSVTSNEIGRWLGTPAGELFQIWKSLQAATPGATHESAAELIASASPEQYDEIGGFLVKCLLKTP